MGEEAISYALAAGHLEGAASLIERFAHPLFSDGKMATLARWLETLPDQVIRDRQRLFLVWAWVLVRTGRPDKLARELELNPLSAWTNQDDSLRGELAAIQAGLAFHDGDFARSIRLCEQALELIPRDNLLVRMPALSVKAWSNEARGDLAGATRLHSQAAAMASKAGSLTGSLVSRGFLAQLFAAQGMLGKAEAAFDEAVETANRRGGSRLPLLGLAYIGMGEVRVQQNRLGEASRLLRHGLELCKQWPGLAVWTLKGFGVLSRILDTQGDAGQARALRSEALELGREQNAPLWAMQALGGVETSSGRPEPVARQDGPNSLTEREYEVLRVLARGFSSRDIAEELCISVSTVRTHLKRIYPKLDAHSRHEAITRARQKGLL